MRKIEFITSLYEKLSGLPQDEVEERIAFYAEMIDERMEEGMAEDEAVLAAGSVDEIAAQIVADIPFVKIAKESIVPKRRMKAWEIVLLVLGAPLWLSLLLAAFAVLLSVYISLWSVVISLWAVEVSVVASTVVLVVAGLVFAVKGSVLAAAATWGIALVCTGLFIFGFFGCRVVSRGMAFLTKQMALGMKRMFIRKESAA